MNPAAWQLAGPARYVRQATRDLLGGSSVILQLPPHVPMGLSAEIRRLLAENDCVRWVSPNPGELDFSSVVNLAASLHEKWFSRNLDGLGEIDSLVAAMRYSAVFLEVSDAVAWKVLRELLDRFRRAASAVEEGERGCFSIALSSRLPAGPGEIGLNIYPWKDVVSALDVWRWVHEQAESVEASEIERSLRCSLVVELAAYDLCLAERLATVRLSGLCAPVPFLKQYALAHEDWTEDPVWENGSLDNWRGAAMSHSAWLALRGREAEIARRIWHGQLAVLFPYLERCRLHFLPLWSRSLRLPVETPEGIVYEPEDLELGQLAYHLNGRLPREQWQCLTRLRNWRHELAHLRPIRDLDFTMLPQA